MQLNPELIKQAGETLTFFCHGQARHNGWWTELLTCRDLTSTGYPLVAPNRNVGELLALVHSEISEGATETDEIREARLELHKLVHVALDFVHRDYISKLALVEIHRSLSQALEGHRKGLMDDKLPHRPMLEVELADAVIRILDAAGGLDLDVAGAIAEKLAYNATRADHKPEHRRAVGGKRF